MRCCPVAGSADGQSTTLHWLVKRELSCSVGATDISPLRNGILTMEAVTYAEIITQASMPESNVTPPNMESTKRHVFQQQIGTVLARQRDATTCSGEDVGGDPSVLRYVRGRGL
ncbi:hypothetical protein GW17_00039850 [Ensete ventricosum]|nr:hypothetical protein GW17_00039850 [Ensete ventricosum]